MERELVIFGAGGIAREIAAWAGVAGYRVIAFVDALDPGRTLHDRPVIGRDGLPQLAERGAVFLAAVGSPRLRRRLVEEAVTAGLAPAPALVHPSATLDVERVHLGPGTVVCPGCALTTDITVEEHAQVNLQCTIGHDARLRAFATLSPGVRVSGWVEIGPDAFLGTGAIVIDGRPDEPVRIGEGAVVGAGAVVLRDVAPGVTAVGIPARPVSGRTPGRA